MGSEDGENDEMIRIEGEKEGGREEKNNKSTATQRNETNHTQERVLDR